MRFLEGQEQRKKRIVEPEVPQSRRVIPKAGKTPPVRVAFTPRLLATFRLEGWNSATSGNTGEILTERSRPGKPSYPPL